MIIRRSFNGHLTALSVGNGEAMIALGDLASPSLVQRFRYTPAMARRRRVERAGQQFVPLAVVREWVADLVQKDFRDQAQEMQQVIEWAERTIEDARLQRV